MQFFALTIADYRISDYYIFNTLLLLFHPQFPLSYPAARRSHRARRPFANNSPPRFSVLIFHALHFTLLLDTTLRRAAAHFPMLIRDALFVARPLLAALFRYQFNLFIARAPSPGVNCCKQHTPLQGRVGCGSSGKGPARTDTKGFG
jgi:hypothetical protein